MGLCLHIQATPLTFDDLRTYNFDDLKPYIPPIKGGIVIKVYDGDTCTIAAPINNIMYRFPVRFRGIDAPEMKSINPDERAHAKQSQLYLETLILNQRVELRDLSVEKYGRLLANVYYDDVCINDLMVHNHYAKVYSLRNKIIE